MSNLDFIELAYEHWEALLFCISFSFICYILIFKSWYISILDPFVLSAVLSACGFGVVIFLFLCNAIQLYNPQIQISAESETKRSIFREKDKTKRSKKESAQHSKSRNKSFVMTSVSAL